MTTLETNSFDALMTQGMAASQANDAEQAITCFQKASDALPEAGLPQFLLGAEFAALGDMNRAETAFANATRLMPAFPMARYQLGLLQFSSGRAAIALLTWQPLLELPETDALPHFVAGFTALAQDRPAEALTHFDRGLPLNRDNEALSGDIVKVMNGIRAAIGSTQLASSSPTEAEAHVLLAGYQQRGPAH